MQINSILIMEEIKPKSIQTVGFIISILSVFTIASNLGGIASSDLMKGMSGTGDAKTNAIDLLITYYTELCLFMATLGILYLIAGVFICNYKLWANKLATFLSILVIILLWIAMISLAITVGYKLFVSAFLTIALIFTIPMGLLIRFLNKKSIRKYFS